MSTHQANLGTLVIASGATATTTPITKYLDDAAAITIASPAAVTGTITVQGSVDGGSTYQAVQSGGNDVVCTAGDATVISPFPFNALRVTSSTDEAAARTFTVIKTFTVTR